MTLFLLSAFLSHLIAKILSSLRWSVSRLSALVSRSTGFPLAQQQRMRLQYRRPRFNPGVGRSLGGGNGYPLHYSCLENSMARGSLVGCSPEGCKESDTTDASEHTRRRQGAQALLSPPSSPLPSSTFVLSMPFYCVVCSLPDPDLFFSCRVYSHPVK